MGGKRGLENINMVSKPASGGDSTTLIILWKDWKKKKIKLNLSARGSVGSPTSTGYGPIEVNIYGGTFLLL